MYKKGAVLELQFSASRLNDGAGEPYWIDLSREEATRLMEVLRLRLEPGQPDSAPPAIVNLDGEDDPVPAEGAQATAHADGAASDAWRQWICIICGWVYDEAEGLPEEGIAPGTRWEDIPDDWTCPDCGVSKEDFEMVELD